MSQAIKDQLLQLVDRWKETEHELCESAKTLGRHPTATTYSFEAQAYARCAAQLEVVAKGIR